MKDIKKEYNNKNNYEYSQKIGCNVVSCAHNSVENSTCRLENIKVTPCAGVKGDGSAYKETLCSSFLHVADLNMQEKSSGKSQST
jgi:hypothetical protein